MKRFVLPAALCATGWLMLSLALAGPASAQTASLIGRVLKPQRELPLEGATVRLEPGAHQAVTDARGRFTFNGLTTGGYRLIVEHIGYATRNDSIDLSQARVHDVDVRMHEEALRLQPIVVIARSDYLSRVGFYDRRLEGLSGHFITRIDIERQGPIELTDLFRSMPGTVLRSSQLGKRQIRFNRVGGQGGMGPDGCLPDMYLDGFIVGGSPGASRLDNHDIVPPREIEALEVYMGAATPLQYRNPCGVILVWTRKGR